VATVRNTDRWVTPGVIITGLLVAGVVVLSVVAAVAYLAARGVDPDPLLRLVASLVAAVGSLGTLALQLTTRATTAKVERNTGRLNSATERVVQELDKRAGRHASPPTDPMGTAPAAAPGSR
jgi:hypothetical protein